MARPLHCLGFALSWIGPAADAAAAGPLLKDRPRFGSPAAVLVKDRPRFGYRGVLMDTAHHFKRCLA